MLGGSNSFSGPLAFTGEQATKFGVDLYVKVVNDAGGINGRKIRTVFYDDGYRPQDAVANTRKLVEQDGIFAVIAPQGTPPVVATLDYLGQNKVPLLFPFQGSPMVRGHRYVFSGMTLYDRQSKMMIDYLVGPAEVQDVRRHLPGRRVRQGVPDRVREGPGPPQSEADAPPSRSSAASPT